jgi:hypothetical protein
VPRYNLPDENKIIPSKRDIAYKDSTSFSQKGSYIQGKRYSQSKALDSMMPERSSLSNTSNSQKLDTSFQETAADSFVTSQKSCREIKRGSQKNVSDSKIHNDGVLTNISNSQNRDTMFQESAADSITYVLKSANINDDEMFLFIISELKKLMIKRLANARKVLLAKR